MDVVYMYREVAQSQFKQTTLFRFLSFVIQSRLNLAAGMNQIKLTGFHDEMLQSLGRKINFFYVGLHLLGRNFIKT